MNAAAAALIADMEPDKLLASLRQWAFFPALSESHVQAASPQTFRLLVESAAGRLAIVTVALRTAPDMTLAANLARLLDERPFELASRERIGGEFESRHGVTLALLDVDLDQDDPMKLTSAIPRAIAQAARGFGKPESGKLSLSELRAAVSGRLEHEWQTIRAEFVSRLNAEVVGQARAIDGLRPSSYNYLNTASAEQQRNRAQAMAFFPLLQPVLMTPPFDAVRSAIDAGLPLIDVLAAHHQAPKAMIRILRGVTQVDLGHLAGKLGTVVSLLKEIPPDWWPRDAATWRRFTHAADTIARISRQPITTATNQLWLRRCAQNNYEMQDRTPEELVRMGQDIDEFMEALRRALYWVLHDTRKHSANRSGKSPYEIAIAFKVGLGLDRISQLARRFGDAYRRAVTEFAEEAELWRGVRWPALGEGVREYGEILIQQLLTPVDLKEEGSRMGNCVASYVEQCMKGKSQIWSVRLRDGTQLSTLETRIRTHSNGRRVLLAEQHKGIRNGVPTALAVKAAYDHTAYFSDSPESMQTYLNWKQTISRQPLDARQRHALMQPIVTALEQILPGKWSWQRIVEMGSVP